MNLRSKEGFLWAAQLCMGASGHRLHGVQDNPALAVQEAMCQAWPRQQTQIEIILRARISDFLTFSLLSCTLLAGMNQE